MTLKEMSGAYQDQADILRERIRSLRETRHREENWEERFRLGRRISALEDMCRETRELAVLLERYYDREYRPSGKYTI